MLLQILFLSVYSPSSADKCYSCSSALLHSRWPKNEDSNKLQFLNDFPVFSNDSCDSIKGSIPVVDCPDSVCIKAIIKEPPAKRDVCVEAGAIVRDCWSRVMKEDGSLNPMARNNMLWLSPDGSNTTEPVGYIYTCEGYLCNSSPGCFSSLLAIATAASLL